MMIETVAHGELELAIIIRREYAASGIHFFTPESYSQQLGYMSRPRGYVIPPHVHVPAARQVEFTQEVLFVRKGKVRVDFYAEDHSYLRSTVLNHGDVILLAFGGHGFEILEDAEIVEVKQGPYAGEKDKTRFAPVETGSVNIESKQ